MLFKIFHSVDLYATCNSIHTNTHTHTPEHTHTLRGTTSACPRRKVAVDIDTYFAHRRIRFACDWLYINVYTLLYRVYSIVGGVSVVGGCADVLIQSALNRIIQSYQSLCQHQSKSHSPCDGYSLVFT